MRCNDRAKRVLAINPFSLEIAPIDQWLKARNVDLHMILSSSSVKGLRTLNSARLTRSNLRVTILPEDNFRKSSRLVPTACEIIEREKIDAVVYVDEHDVERAACLSDYYGLPGLPFDVALQYRDKAIMKAALKEVVQLPKYCEVSSDSELIHAAKVIGYPCVLKKARGAAAVGTVVFSEFSEVLSFLEANSPLTDKHLLEAFIRGEMFHVDGIAVNGRLEFAFACQYFQNSLDYRKKRVYGHYTLPPECDESIELINLTKDVVQTLGYSPGGAFHAEFWKCDNRFVFCEIGARVGGGAVGSFSKELLGINLLRESILVQLGERRSRPIKRVDTAIVGGISFSPCNGLLLSAPKHCDIPGVIKFKQRHTIGEIYSGGEVGWPRPIVSFLTKTASTAETLELFEELSFWVNQNYGWHITDNS